ncbi:MAG: hypothetical protein JRG90_18280 [Deltaproteobacteria bacterium]|nr:hypothetical protein [Deltaproteobacteria bacterium]
MPRTLFQGIAFLIGFWIALAVSPMTVKVARADVAAETEFADLEARLFSEVNALETT